MRGESPQKAFPLGGRWPEGADEGAMIERFRSSQGNISPPAGGEFLSQRWERNQRIAGDAADGLRLRYAPPRSIGPLSPDPLYEGRVPVRSCNSFGAQNLSGWSEFLPGHWALSSPKLQQLRFHNCAWRCRTNAPGSKHRHLIRPLRGHLPLKGKALKSKPFAFPFRGRWHGEAVTDEGNGPGYEGGPFEP